MGRCGVAAVIGPRKFPAAADATRAGTAGKPATASPRRDSSDCESWRYVCSASRDVGCGKVSVHQLFAGGNSLENVPEFSNRSRELAERPGESDRLHPNAGEVTESRRTVAITSGERLNTAGLKERRRPARPRRATRCAHFAPRTLLASDFDWQIAAALDPVAAASTARRPLPCPPVVAHEAIHRAVEQPRPPAGCRAVMPNGSERRFQHRAERERPAAREDVADRRAHTARSVARASRPSTAANDRCR